MTERSIGYILGKKKELQASKDGLIFTTPPADDEPKKAKQDGTDEVLTILWRDVLGVEDKTETEEKKSAMMLHYIYTTSDKYLQKKSVSITFEDGSAQNWTDVIDKQCANVPGRPKTLLVFINPVSGNWKAKQMYEKSAVPLFSLAGIKVTVKETEKVKHGLEIAQQEDLSKFDGLVCVGGDGLYQEVLQGVLLQAQTEAKVDVDSSSSAWARSTIPIGCLPAGSGNCMVQSCNDGVIDMETAVLRIIKGEVNHGMCYVTFSNGKFLCAGSVCWGYGIFGDMVVRREELRWLGRLGLPVAVLSILMRRRRMFKCDLEYLQEKSEKKVIEGDGLSEKDKSFEEWIKYEGGDQPICSIHSFAVELLDAGDKFVGNHFGTFPSLVVDRGCSTFGLIKHIATFSGKKYDPPASLDIIEKAKAFRFKLYRDEAETDENVSAARAKERRLEKCLNLDGELYDMDVPQIEVRTLPSFIPLYSCLPTLPAEAATKQSSAI